MDQYQSAALIAALQSARDIVVFSGAGISTESGIPSFRDTANALWQQFSVDEFATADGYAANSAQVWQWYQQRRLAIQAALPNAGHLAVSAMQQSGRKITVVTQNVDDLHERAGSQSVIHLHGRLDEAYCQHCGSMHDLKADRTEQIPPRCSFCGGQVRPAVVWFDEALPLPAWQAATTAMKNCDLLIVVGTSAQVQPASHLPLLALQQQATMLFINPDSSGSLAKLADFCFEAAAGLVLPRLAKLLTASCE